MDKKNKPTKRHLSDSSDDDIRENAKKQNATYTSTDWPRYLIITSESEALKKLSPFAVEKGIRGIAGEPKSVKRLRSGDLLVEVATKNHAMCLLNAPKLALVPISVSPHRSLNTKKGVIRCRELDGESEESIAESLANQNVTAVKRIKVTRNGERVNTHTYVLSFSCCELPTTLKIGYLREPVRPYIPNPLRCFKCQRFGHHRNNCRQSTDACVRCGSRDHSENCNADPVCVNCGGGHEASSRNCTVWQTEKRIMELKVTKNVTYQEAKRLSQAENTLPTGGKTFATAVAAKATTSTSTVQCATAGTQTDVSFKNHNMVYTFQTTTNIPKSQSLDKPRKTLSARTRTTTSLNHGEAKKPSGAPEKGPKSKLKKTSVQNIVTSVKSRKEDKDVDMEANVSTSNRFKSLSQEDMCTEDDITDSSPCGSISRDAQGSDGVSARAITARASTRSSHPRPTIKR